MGARPSSSYKGPERGRGGGGEVGRGEARLAREKLRPGPGRATNGAGGTMEAAAAAPRRRLLLIVLVAVATLLPGTKGERRAGACGARGPGPASGSLLLFLKHGAGPGAQVAAPGRPGFPDPAGATRAGAGRRGGAGAVSGAGGRAPGGWPSEAPGGSDWISCGGLGMSSGARGRPGPWPPSPFPSGSGPGTAGVWTGTGVEAVGGSELGGLPRGL